MIYLFKFSTLNNKSPFDRFKIRFKQLLDELQYPYKEIEKWWEFPDHYNDIIFLLEEQILYNRYKINELKAKKIAIIHGLGNEYRNIQLDSILVPTLYHTTLRQKYNLPCSLEFFPFPIFKEDFYIFNNNRLNNILYTGRIIPDKLPQETIQLLYEQNLHIDLYGPTNTVYWDDQIITDPKIIKYINFISNMPNCTLYGYKPYEQMNSIFNQYKVSFYPSNGEAINLSVIESILAGTIPITLNLEIYNMYTKLPKFYNYNDMVNFAQFILDNEYYYYTLRYNIRKEIEKYFDKSLFLNKLDKIIKKFL